MFLSWMLLVPIPWGVKELLFSICWLRRAVPLGRITQRSTWCWGGAMVSDRKEIIIICTKKEMSRKRREFCTLLYFLSPSCAMFFFTRLLLLFPWILILWGWESAFHPWRLSKTGGASPWPSKCSKTNSGKKAVSLKLLWDQKCSALLFCVVFRLEPPQRKVCFSSGPKVEKYMVCLPKSRVGPDTLQTISVRFWGELFSAFLLKIHKTELLPPTQADKAQTHKNL